MSSSDFLHWFLAFPDEPDVDVEWAVERFRRKFNKLPENLLVPPAKEKYYQGFDFSLKVIADKRIGDKYIGLE